MTILGMGHLLFLDLEVNPADNHIFKVGALSIVNYGQANESIIRYEKDTRSISTLKVALQEIAELGKGANYLVGHNLIEHDLPLLRDLGMALDFLELDVIDTLQLSPLAFPKNPYHRLLKDYKLIRSELNSPLQDCEATNILLKEQLVALTDFAVDNLNELRCYQTILSKVNPTYASILSQVTKHDDLENDEFKSIMLTILRNDNTDIEMSYKVCTTRLNKFLNEDTLFELDVAFPFLYTLSWLHVAGSNSVLAPWVRYQFPQTATLISMLREESCQRAECSYCNTIHNPQKELQRYFGFDDFRYEDIDKNESIQRDIVEIGMKDENIFAILPTGGGKSLCYQLPALNRYFRNGSLTIIISPLQALMKDQVDGLIEKNIHCVAALNGLLSMPERADVLEKVQMGDIGVLFVSPEQFRSSRFKRAIEQRQIGAWIYDEAHCLSKWGSDFRPDYLYVAKCIKDFAGKNAIPHVGCFTATAKQEVIDDIKSHFKEVLGLSFIDKISLKERENLSFDIVQCESHEKTAIIAELLDTHINEEGGGIVFVARRKNAEDIAKQLQAQGWNCQYFHAGLPANEKKDIQNDFIAGDIKVIVSTNAFGMGVDKENVRLVVHADIPGSLENYLQEAGRAGRDQAAAKCILLYEPSDIETQFQLTEFSKLTYGDIVAIYRKIRTEHAKRNKSAELIISPREILKDALVESIDVDNDNATTKVITAVAWLEKEGYLERTDNVVRIFPAHLKVSLEEALEKIHQENIGQRRTQEFVSIIEYIAKSPSDKIIATDILADLIAGGLEDVADILQQLQKMGILTNNTLLTAYVRHGIVDTTQRRLELCLWCEDNIFSLLSEIASGVEADEWYTLDLTLLCNRMNELFEGHALKEPLKGYLLNKKIMPKMISKILKVLCEDKGFNTNKETTSQSIRNEKNLEIRNDCRRDVIQLKVHKQSSWQDIEDNGAVRRLIAQEIVSHLIKKAKGQGKDLLVETTFEELQVEIFSNSILVEQYSDPEQQRAMIENALLYLHNLQMLTLNHGMTVMRNALTIKVNPDAHNRYRKEDYKALENHYKERRLQIHVMREYAEIGLKALQDALKFVLDYFSLREAAFNKRYFKGRENILELATSEDSWHAIVGNLNEVQRKIVESNDDNRLILAGPGSGKTRVIVHRIAYLLRVQRVPSHAIIALAYNRAAANEIRKRLYEVVGKESYGVTIMTYHSIAMRLTGSVYENSQNDLSESAIQDRFKAMIKDAIEMLRGNDTGLDLHDEEDDARTDLLRGYRYILVDEYQDIDDDQYSLISALAGRNLPDEDGKLTILAVGDDDQNIYTFRGSSNQYIDRFTEDYSATMHYLVENYRSTKGIIEASNDVIGINTNRLKAQYPITIDQNRADDPHYGRWETIDANRAGRVVVRILAHENYQAQAFIVIHELSRLKSIDPEALNSCAILSRKKSPLACFAGGLESRQYDYYYEHDKSSHFSTPSHRYFQQLLSTIAGIGRLEVISDIWTLISLDDYPDRWKQYFEGAFEQLILAFNELSGEAHSIIQWLLTYAYEIPISAKKGIFLGTMHSAKGLEFDHVFILDDLDSFVKSDNEEERRLFYVGMTRAKETLMLCSFGKKHTMIESIQNILNSPVSKAGDMPSLHQKHVLLSPKDIYMDYLGSLFNEADQKASACLEEGALLVVEKVHERLVFKYEKTGAIVCKSAKNFAHNDLDLDDIIHCSVHSITQRRVEMIKDEGFRARCRCEIWEVIQPLIILKG